MPGRLSSGLSKGFLIASEQPVGARGLRWPVRFVFPVLLSSCSLAMSGKEAAFLGRPGFLGRASSLFAMPSKANKRQTKQSKTNQCQATQHNEKQCNAT
eukprot:1105195-Pyramimonas_sp.AAC.1